MWLLSGLLAFVRLQSFAPEDAVLFNTLVTSLSKSLAHQASVSASHTVFIGLKRREFYSSHLPAYFSDVNKRAMLSSLTFCLWKRILRVCWQILRPPLRSTLNRPWLMSPLMAPLAVANSLVLAILRPAPRLLAVAGGFLVLLLIRKSVRVLICLLHLQLSKVRTRVFANRGHVPRPAGWGVVLRHTGRFGSHGELILVWFRSSASGIGSLFVLSPSLSCPTLPSELHPHVHLGVGSCCCSGRSAREGSHRTGSLFPRLLQLSLCDTQGHWRVAFGDWPLTPQRLGGCLSFSHGDCPVSSPVSLSGGLDGILDLWDAYLQIPVYPSSRWYLRFWVGESVFQFRALCFGLSTALQQAFTRVMAPVSSIMHQYGFRILRYLDGWLILGSSFREIVRARNFLLWLCQELGIHVNLPESSLAPTQSIDYLGMKIQTSPLRVFPTLKRVQKLFSLVQDFLSCCHHRPSVWDQLLGVMSSVLSLVPGARLHMRSLQLRLNVAGCRLVDNELVSWDDSCLSDLRWWSDISHLQAGLPLDTPQPSLFRFMDALDTGWVLL